MKKIIALALLAVVATGANAKGKKQPKVDPNKPVFTIVKENPITSVGPEPFRYLLGLLYLELLRV